MSKLNALAPAVKQSMRDMGRRVGLEVRPSGVNSREDLRLAHFLALHKIDLVLDIGANIGQFANELLAAGFTGHIISFEPLPDAHARLTVAANAHSARWTVAPRMALSDSEGTAQFYVTQSSACSSLLAPGKELTDISSGGRVTQSIDVPTQRLDELIGSLGLTEKNFFLKIDVQGGERKVLDGAAQALALARGMLIELTLTELYKGQPSAFAIQQTVFESGLKLWDIWPGFRDAATHRLNQFDALYFRE